ncbi:MAG: hypothetical protein WD276_08105, partial [Actinomycetota bacterium]
MAAESRARWMTPETRLVALIAVVVAILAFFFSPGGIQNSDGRTVFLLTESIVERGELNVDDEQLGTPGVGGRYFSRFGLGLSLLSVVPYLIALPVADTFGTDSKFLLQASAGFLMPLIAGALTAALYALGRRLGAKPRASALVSLGIIGGTFMLPYVRDFSTEAISALCVVVAVERSLAKSPVMSGVSLGAAALVRPQSILLFPLFLLSEWKADGFRSALRQSVPLLISVGINIWYNFVRFADIGNFGYPDAGFTTPLLRGTVGLLFHPSTSLLLFAPVVLLLPFGLLALGWKSKSFWLLSGTLLITFVMAATWTWWSGGWGWGPRLLLPGLIPALVSLAPWADHGWRRRRTPLIALFVVGFVVSAPTLIASTRAQQVFDGGGVVVQPEIGMRNPIPWEQHRLVPAVVSFTRTHLYERLDDHSLRYIDTWQFVVARVLGRGGFLASLVVS